MIIVALLLINLAYAGVTHFETMGLKVESYAWTEVCDRSGVRHHPLIEARDLHRLDCMGTIIEGKDFCVQRPQEENRGFLRALINKDKKVLECQYGREAIISYQCKNGETLCSHEKVACQKLGSVFASHLKLQRAILQQEAKTQISCHFSNISTDEIQELDMKLSAPERL